ncbi:hypothetical protein A3Q56_00411 [Intoshia linei]|uniref:Uncharacterized protein n=1 Tax=Intoshia linei TaxID=1819745 RepID=A0A177BDX3_9BILA|nr:hypothetical protein A3Q56_00411 [Intoshia linei]
MINSYSRCVPTNTSLNNYNNCNSCNMKTEEKLSLIRSGLNNNLQYQKYNKVDFGTQTVGIIYPFKNPNQKEKSCNVINNNSASKSTYTYLNQISPGKGYWRVQLDHMYAHIKSYATKNANFRDLISEVNLGKIISTTVTEDSTEFTMSATFQYHGTTLVRTMKKEKVLHKFSNLLQDRMPEKKKLSIEDKKCHYEKQFLKSVGNRNSKLDEIQYFIDNGINVDAKNKHGMSALHIAVTTNYHKLVKLLLENGANINILSKPKNNTPLHDSILNGNDGIKIIEILLGFGADARRTNNKKQTPYDIAVNLGLKKIASLLYKHVTNKQIESCIIDKKL